MPRPVTKKRIFLALDVSPASWRSLERHRVATMEMPKTKYYGNMIDLYSNKLKEIEKSIAERTN